MASLLAPRGARGVFFSLLPLLGAALLALHPLALAVHVALEEGLSSCLDLRCASRHEGAPKHDAHGCQTCEALALAASSQVDLDGLAQPALGEPRFLGAAAPAPAQGARETFTLASAMPRAPPLAVASTNVSQLFSNLN